MDSYFARALYLGYTKYIGKGVISGPFFSTFTGVLDTSIKVKEKHLTDPKTPLDTLRHPKESSHYTMDSYTTPIRVNMTTPTRDRSIFMGIRERD